MTTKKRTGNEKTLTFDISDYKTLGDHELLLAILALVSELHRIAIKE